MAGNAYGSDADYLPLSVEMQRHMFVLIWSGVKLGDGFHAGSGTHAPQNSMG
jgi:hypothetical protein